MIVFLIVIAFAWDQRVVPLTLFDSALNPLDRPVLAPSNWLSIGHAVLPLVFLLTNLVNRRYGEDTAAGFVLFAWGAVALIAIAMMYRYLPNILVPHELPSLRVATAFFGSAVIAQLVGVYVFDGARGVVWWKAPLYSALATSFVLAFLFYPVAFAGADAAWINHMSIDAGVKAAMSFALLLPYLALRPLVRPLGGFGGF